MKIPALIVVSLLGALPVCGGADASLLARLTFEDRSAQPADSAGVKTKVTLVGRAGYGRGPEGASGIKLLEGGHLVLSNPKVFVKDTQAVTVAFWTKADEFPARTRLVQKGAHENEWRIEINYKGEFVWQVFGKATAGGIYTRPPSTGEWVHVTAIHASDNTLALYFNGQRVGSRTSSPEKMTFGRAPVVLGGGWDASERVVEPYTGYFDDFRYYNRALSAEEIAALVKR